jgi:glyoxylase-like metal-dependent hydrolase (beta-lactamase superfamily II)
MRPVDEIQQVNDRLVFWQGYDPAVKVDLSSYSYLTPAGWALIDPIPLREEVLDEWSGRQKIAAILLTNANHERASADYRKKSGARILAHVKSQGAFTLDVDQWIQDGEDAYGLAAIHLPGFVEGEIALHAPEAGGVMMMGDALINLQSTGFTLLPDKYCDDPKLARKSLQKLLQFSFEVMTFAHGLPIIAGARRQLEQLLQ